MALNFLKEVNLHSVDFKTRLWYGIQDDEKQSCTVDDISAL